MNMLKLYVPRDSEVKSSVTPAVPVSVTSVPASDCSDTDGLTIRSVSVTGARLQNSEILKDLKIYMLYLSEPPEQIFVS